MYVSIRKIGRKIRENQRILLEILIILTLILTTTLVWVPSGKPKTIASLVSFDLNGETRGELQAQLLVDNQTSHELEQNLEIISRPVKRRFVG